MRTRSIWGSAVMAVTCALGAAAEDGADVAIAHGAADQWYVNLDVQWVGRGDSPRSQSLAGHNNGTPGDPSDDRSTLNAHQLQPGPSFEPEASVGYRLDDAWSFELSYFGISSMTDRASTTGAADLDVPFTSAYADNFRNASAVSARYETELRDFEVSLGYRANQYASYVIGVGYVGMYDQFRLRSDNGQTSSYTVNTDNNLVGLQVGTDATFPLSSRWSVTARGRVGAFNNHVEYSHFLGDFGDTVTLRDASDRENNFAWRGEIGVEASYSFNRQWHAWAGYRLSYVENVFLAPEQVDLNTAPSSGSSLSHEGSALFHGPVIGLIYSFP